MELSKLGNLIRRVAAEIQPGMNNQDMDLAIALAQKVCAPTLTHHAKHSNLTLTLTLTLGGDYSSALHFWRQTFSVGCECRNLPTAVGRAWAF